MNRQYDFTYLFCFLFVLLFAQTAQAQKKKGPYVEIEALIQAENYAEARNKLIAFNQQYPSNALSRFELAKIYKRKFESQYVHNEENIGTFYDEAVLLFEKAQNLLNKKELKDNRVYYDEMFGKKAYTIESIHAHIEEYVQSMQRMLTKLTQLRLRFASIPGEYEFCQNTFVQIITNYKTLTDMHINITDRDIVKLGNIERKYGELQKSIDFYKQFFRDDSFADMHQQHFTFAAIEGMNAYRVDKRDFLEKKIKLFKYGTWATSIKAKAQEVRALHAKMFELDSVLSELMIVEQYPEDFTSKVVELKLDTWKKQLLQVDQHAGKVMELFDFKLKKLNFRHREQQVQQEFAISYPDSATRDQYIGELIDMLLDLNKTAQAIDSRTSSYKNYETFVNTRYGGRDGLFRLSILEENYVTAKLNQWNTIRVKMPSIAPIYPDSVMFEDTRLILRPAKMKLRSLLDSGFYVTERLYPCQDSGFVVTGKYEVNQEKRLFVSKINRLGAVQWLHDFDAQNQLTTQLEKVTPYQNGMTLLFAHIERDDAERLMMMVFSDTGAVLMERLVARIPVRMYLAQETPGIIFVNQASNISGMLEGFEKYEVIGLRFDGGKSVSHNLLLRGNIVDILPTGNGVRMVGNFLEYQDLNGQFADSRAYVKNGYNVFVADIFLDDQPNKITPIFSLEPIAVSKVELDVDNKLLLSGFKGDFKYNSPTNILGGEVWEATVD